MAFFTKKTSCGQYQFLHYDAFMNVFFTQSNFFEKETDL